MQLYEVIWKNQFVEKLAVKHNVTTDEVEQVLFARPHVRKAQKVRIKGEDLYAAYGKTYAGSYLIIFFICQEFPSYEAAAEFWDTHDTTDYLDVFETVLFEAELQQRRFEVQIDEDLMQILSQQAKQKGIAVSELINNMLREKLEYAV